MSQTETSTQPTKRKSLVGQIVTLLAFGRSTRAIVLAERFGEVSHLGSSGEPLLTLAYIDPARESNVPKDKETGAFVFPAGRLPQVFTEHDVVHASHAFSEEFKRKNGSSPAQVAAQRGHGEWTEFEADVSDLLSDLRTSLRSAQKGDHDNYVESRKQAARADKAEADLKFAQAEIAELLKQTQAAGAIAPQGQPKPGANPSKPGADFDSSAGSRNDGNQSA